MHSVLRGRLLALTSARALLFSLGQLPFVSAAPLLAGIESLHAAEDGKPTNDPSLWLYLGIAAALVLTGGAFAGLTIALMGQDELYLQVIQTSGEGSEKKHAASVLNLLSKGKHWVLVTLLLSNVIVNETLPIILDRSLGGGWPAVLGSTALIVIFGEVVPQSICVRYGLPIGAWMAPAVLALMYLMSPVAWPVAKLLDRLLGEEHGTFYKKAGLKTLMTLHKNLGSAGEQLNSDEVTIISAVLDLKEKAVGSIMIPMDDVFTMSTDTILDENMMDLILSQGYSRIPIHSPDNPLNFVGMLLVKMLITYDPEDCKQVRDFSLATLPETRAETSCLDIVNFFQEGKSHMVLVSEYPGEDYGALGVVTLEDVIEELIGEEIIDESDVFIDVHKAIRRLTPAPKSRVPKGRFVTEPPAAATTETADAEIQSEFAKSPTKFADDETVQSPKRSASLSKYDSPPQTTFYLRRFPTFDTSSESTPIAKRGPTPEIREQLKHLGPSNLAKRPRQTRYSNVKIKPGTNSPVKPNSTPYETDSRTQTLSSPSRPSEATSLLGNVQEVKSAGKSASDGIRALRASYGTTADQLQQSKEPDTPTANKAVNTEDNTRPPQSRDKLSQVPEHNGGSWSASGSSNEGGVVTPPYQPRGPTRSGSITEQIVDSNGIRKVILETGSSPSGDSDKRKVMSEKRPGSSDTNNAGIKESLEAAAAAGGPNGSGADDDDDDDLESRQENSHRGKGKSKKRRSRKKKKGGRSKGGDGTAEEQPLLDK